jgi:hypothetical protein
MGWMAAFRYGVGEEKCLERLCRWHREEPQMALLPAGAGAAQ